MNKKEPVIFLKHILESIELIESFVKGISLKDISENKMRESAVIRQIEIIGEAVKNLPLSFREAHKEISWKEIVGARDKLIHNYFGVDLKTIKDIIESDLPVLKKQIQDILVKERVKA